MSLSLLQHYMPEIGAMTITTISTSLERALLAQVVLSVKESIAEMPDFEARPVYDPTTFASQPATT
jgi:hypothetical protein